MDVDAFALQNAYEVNYEPTSKNTVALLDIGASTMTINIVSGTDSLFTRDVGVGGHQYTEFIQKEFNLNYNQAQSLKHGEPIENIDPAEARGSSNPSRKSSVLKYKRPMISSSPQPRWITSTA